MPNSLFDVIKRYAGQRAAPGSLASDATVSVAAKSSKKSKAKKRCKGQIEACRAFVLGFCPDTECQQANLPCCDFFGECNAEFAVECLFPFP